MAAQVAQIVIHGIDAAQKRAAELPRRVRGRLRRLGVYEVDDGFGLRQVELAVQKGAFGEFPRQSLPRAGGKQGLQPGREHRGRAVALQLHGILPGVAVRRAGIDGQRLVDHAPLPVAQRAQHQLPVRRFAQGHTAAQGKNLPRHFRAAVAGQTQNPDRAGAFPRGNRGNHVAHFNCASRKSASAATRPSAKGDVSPLVSAKASRVAPALV